MAEFDREWLERTLKNARKRFKEGTRLMPVYDDDFDLEDMYNPQYVQWGSSDGEVFVPTAPTVQVLPPGCYNVNYNSSIGLFFEKIPVKTEDLVRFPDTTSHKVIDEIKNFWTRQKFFSDYDIAYKRGIIVYGPPGSGKSCAVQLAMRDVVDRKGICLNFYDPSLFMDGLRSLRKIQPETPVVAIMEDLDALIEEHSETSILNILDGVNEIHKVVFLACPSPDMLILKSDLTWTEAGSLSVGDKLIGFDDEGPNRKYRLAKVNSCPIVEKPCYRVVTDHGTVVVSEKHPFLVRLGNRPYEWRAVEDLREGNRIAFIKKPWVTDQSRDGGYLAGQFDGEGTLNFSYNVNSGSTGFRASWVQAEGQVVDVVRQMLLDRNFDVGEHTRTPEGFRKDGDSYKTKTSLYIRGGRWESIRLLGSVRPIRLLDHQRLSDAWDGCRLCCKRAKVISVEAIGNGPVVALDTSTNTFIGEGFLQHNTTNYPNKLGHRVMNRPSRFDKRFRIGFPSKESRRIYFQHLIGESQVEELDIDLDKWVKETDKLSIAHLKELFVAVVILGDDYKGSLKTLKSMKEEVDDKDYENKFGFKSDDDDEEDDFYD
jgi:hypothetical protein